MDFFVLQCYPFEDNVSTIFFTDCSFNSDLAPVVQTLDSTIHRIKIYPVDNAIGLPNTYQLDSDLSGG